MRFKSLDSLRFLLGAQWCLCAFCLGASVPVIQSSLWSPVILLVVLLINLLVALRYPLMRILVFLIAGITWSSWSFAQYKSEVFPADFERVNVLVLGQVIGLPESGKGEHRFRFVIKRAEHSGLKSLSGKVVQLSCYRCPLHFQAGDVWKLTVRMKRPRGYASWGAFDYEKYLFRHRVFARGYVRVKAQNTLVRRLPNTMNYLRQSIRSELATSLGNFDVGRSVVTALTIGDKSGFSREQRRIFQESGTSHLMAISGLHVGLVFAFVYWLMKWSLWPIASIFNVISRNTLSLILAMLAAFFYSSLAGFAVSTQRAMVMLLVYVVCRLFARELSLNHVLLLAMTTLLLYDPFVILDAGFWLSCGAVWVIAVASRAERNLSLLKLQPRLWLGMLPVTTLFFGQVSLISPVVNIIVVPLFCVILIPLTLVGVLLTQIGQAGIASGLLMTVAFVFEQVYLGLEWSTQLPFARYYTTPFSGWQWGVAGLGVVMAYWSLRWHGVVWIGLLVSVLLFNQRSVPGDRLKVTLLDVGQGLAMVIETATRVVVYDTGPKYMSGFTAADAVILPYLRSRGIKKIDKLIISHADNDHIGGYQAVVDAFAVDQVITSRTDKVTGGIECLAGQQWRYDQTSFEIISPHRDSPVGSNNRSCVLMISHLGVRVLISGDIEKSVERHLVSLHKKKKEALKADIMLVPHQGSKTSSTTDFLDLVQAKLALVAAGYRNHYGHPHTEVIERYHERGIEVISTIDSGSVAILIDSAGWRVDAYRHSQQRFWHYQKVSNPSR